MKGDLMNRKNRPDLYKSRFQDYPNVTVAPCSPRRVGERALESEWSEVETPKGFYARVAAIETAAHNYPRVWVKPAVNGQKFRLYVSEV